MLLGPWLWGFAVHALGVLGAIITALLTYSIVVYTIIKKKSRIYVVSVITFFFFFLRINIRFNLYEGWLDIFEFKISLFRI